MTHACSSEYIWLTNEFNECCQMTETLAACLAIGTLTIPINNLSGLYWISQQSGSCYFFSPMIFTYPVKQKNRREQKSPFIGPFHVFWGKKSILYQVVFPIAFCLPVIQLLLTLQGTATNSYSCEWSTCWELMPAVFHPIQTLCLLPATYLSRWPLKVTHGEWWITVVDR